AGALFARRPQERRFADLGYLHISKQTCKCRKLRPGELAEGVERRDSQPRLQRSLASERIEMGARAWGQRSASLMDEAAKLGVARNIIVGQNLARFEPRKLAGEIARTHRRGDQLAGRDIERGKRVGGLAPILFRRAKQCGEEIVSARIEQRLLGERARR